jgi:hypothetical protein
LAPLGALGQEIVTLCVPEYDPATGEKVGFGAVDDPAAVAVELGLAVAALTVYDQLLMFSGKLEAVPVARASPMNPVVPPA